MGTSLDFGGSAGTAAFDAGAGAEFDPGCGTSDGLAGTARSMMPFSITAAVYAAGALLWLAIDPNRPLAEGAPRGTSRQQGSNRPPE